MGGVLSRLRYLEPGFLRDRAAGFARPGRASRTSIFAEACHSKLPERARNRSMKKTI